MDQKEMHYLIIYQNTYFEILTEFFVNVTGSLPRDFSSVDNFSESVHRMGKKVAGNHHKTDKTKNPFSELEKKLKNLYAEKATSAFSSAKKIEACKLNLGGGSRFLGTHLNATRRSILFSDMVLIPDPVMPWIEKKRPEESFNLVNILQSTFFILHLSDLIGVDFDIPPFFVFPSFEKSLENNDIQTQQDTIKLITDVFSHYVDSGITSPENIMEFATKNPDKYFQQIEKSQLFVSPGCKPGETIKSALENYKKEMMYHRSEKWCNDLFSNGDISVVTNAIIERISPNIHLLENSDELRSNPFLCIDSQAHYYQLIAKMKNSQASNAGSFDPATEAILKSLTSHKLDYLANINDSQLIELRKTNENVEFRRELRDLINSLPNAKLEDIGYVASEVCSHIESAVSKHEKKVSMLNDKYAAKHKYTALIVGGTLGVTMMPVLAPFLSVLLPIGGLSTVKYVSDKLDEKAERKGISNSMMGVISLAKRK
jgi:hypothetical protein